MSTPEFINPLEFPVSLVKNEPSDDVIEDIVNLSNEEILPDIKNDTLSHIKEEDSIKSETPPITQVFVKTENDPFIKMENITHSEILIKTEEDTSDGNGVVEVQACHKGFEQRHECSPIIKHIKNHAQFKPHKTEANSRNVKYCCSKCDYETYIRYDLTKHKIVHLKPEEIQYFYCYHCCHKTKRRNDLRVHVLRHFKKEEVPFYCYICDFMTLKRNLIIEHIKTHSKVQIKSEKK